MCQEEQEELSPSLTDEHWSQKFPEPLSWRSDEEDEDSDFGEEQRDRYLKVRNSNAFRNIFLEPFNLCRLSRNYSLSLTVIMNVFFYVALR